jgi:transposase
MTKAMKYSPEAQERTVRLVLESVMQHESQWVAIESVAAKIGCTFETLRRWVRSRQG